MNLEIGSKIPYGMKMDVTCKELKNPFYAILLIWHNNCHMVSQKQFLKDDLLSFIYDT